jgi:hypothetical protein
LESGGIFLGQDLKDTGNKIKSRQMGLHQTKKLLYNKINSQQSEEIIYRKGGNICKVYM